MIDAHRFNRDGYLVIRGAMRREEIHNLRHEAERVVIENKNLLGIGGLADADVMGAVLCLHQPHKLSPAILHVACHDAVTSILQVTLGDQVKLVQSQLFVKGPGKPGNAWHQDESAIPSRDRSLIGVWIALDKATRQSGCLRIVPGTHRHGYIYPQRPHGEPDRYDFPTTAFGFDESAAVDLVMEPGDLAIFSGYAIHGSEPNVSAHYRRALTFHYMNAYSLLPWKIKVRDGEQVVRPALADYRDIVMVIGEDPYEWKGYSNDSVPHLRRWSGPIAAS